MMRRREFISLVGGAALTGSFSLPGHSQQTARMPKLAIVLPSGSTDIIQERAEDPIWPVFFAELRRLGRVEASNLIVERFSAGGVTERHSSLAREVVSGNPDLIFAISNTMARNFKEVTISIPIVTMTTDPMSLGLTASLSRPTGNTTGVITDAGIGVWEKRFELVREIFPAISTAGFLVSRYSWEGSYGQAVRDIAAVFGMKIFAAVLESPIVEEGYRRAFATLGKEGVIALLVNESAENFINRGLIVELAKASRLPTMYPYREYADVGGLLAYATDIKELMRQAADQIEKIFGGAKPSDVPYYQATKFELVVNLKTAKALGLTIPPTLLARADEVIE